MLRERCWPKSTLPRSSSIKSEKFHRSCSCCFNLSLITVTLCVLHFSVQLGMGSDHPQIAGAALGILNVLVEHHLYENLMDPARGFLRQLIALVKGSDLGLQKRAIRMLLTLSASGPHLTEIGRASCRERVCQYV